MSTGAWRRTAPRKEHHERTEKPQKQSAQQLELSPDEINEARQLLEELGYWVKRDAEGVDASLRHAFIAFQKIEGFPHSGDLSKEELHYLRNAQRPQARESGYAHVEIDLCRQVLFVVDCDDAISRILSVSTGSGECFTEGGRTRLAVTPPGRFRVVRKVSGWHKSPLGLLYYPNYIHDGIAIHGNPVVPARPASHGCIRVPIFAAKEFYEMAQIGVVVLVYDSSGQSTF